MNIKIPIDPKFSFEEYILINTNKVRKILCALLAKILISLL